MKFLPLNSSYNRWELKVCDISLYEAIVKMERRIKKVIEYKKDTVIYESHYLDYVISAKKSILL